MGVKALITGTVATLVIGDTAYTVNQKDVVNNFANDTGLTQQQAKDYVENVNKEDLLPYDELGAGLVKDGKDVLNAASQIDCVTYQYEWESATMSCESGKAQLNKLGNDEISLGNSFISLSKDTASTADISTTISLSTAVGSDLDAEIVAKMLDAATIDTAKKSNSYNKAILQSALTNASR
jgi:polyhydroxyalkanoate synthesis regulator phasin